MEEEMIRMPRFYKFCIVFTLGIAVLMSGCSYQLKTAAKSTPDPVMDISSSIPKEDQNPIFGPLCKTGQSYVRLPDGTEIFLAAETEIEISSLSDISTGATGHEILLRHGQIVILSQLNPGIWLTIVNPSGYTVRFDGSLMLIGFDQNTGRFSAVCLNEICELGSDPEDLIPLAQDSWAWLDENGVLRGPFEIDTNELREGCSEDFISATDPPTSTPEIADTPSPDLAATATPDLAATATAFCGEFEEENPGTPCP
jgi:hypothetical protein